MRFEAASPRENHGGYLWVLSIPRFPVPASLHFLALSAGASALYTLPVGINYGGVVGTQGI